MAWRHVEEEIPPVVGDDGVSSPSVVSGYNFWYTGRNGGHHCGMIQFRQKIGKILQKIRRTELQMLEIQVDHSRCLISLLVSRNDLPCQNPPS